MINIHLYPSDFSCETRIEKQAKSITGRSWLISSDVLSNQLNEL